MDTSRHPCFSDSARHTYGRIHLPVAPKCNMQCNYCSRKYDCVNESRPGVTSAVLSPWQALTYLDSVMEKIDNLAVVGIAGPGDPFANGFETMQTLRLVREKYPDMLLCVASNGLEILPYIDELARLKTGHVTITINAVDPEIGAKIYAWARPDGRLMRGKDAAEVILRNQLEAIVRLKEKGITVKVNTIVMPGINAHHIPAVAKRVAGLGADIMNCIALYHVPGTAFEHVEPPDAQTMEVVRGATGKYIANMKHCARCRADAVGMLGQANSSEIEDLLHSAAHTWATKERPYVAVASMEGLLVNRHLGEAKEMWIYEWKNGAPELLACRPMPPAGDGLDRWRAMAEILSDCNTVLVSGIGQTPRSVLEESGMRVVIMEGLARTAIEAIYEKKEIPKAMTCSPALCGFKGKTCGGTGMGCG